MSNGTTTWNFTYNADGLRTKRTNGTTTYHYVYNGDKLSQMTVGSNLLQFSYDAAGTPMAVLFNGTTYYYATNLQGDVIAILDASGTAVVEYTYDAWGNLLTTDGSMKDTLGTTNPLRYRGYVYDQEYGFYYLSTRYYNPEVGRFLNADNYHTTGTGFLGSNMFSYCNNTPISCSDSHGARPVSILERFGDTAIPAPPKMKRKNDAAVSAFYGVSAPKDIPEIPDGAMLFVENITSVNIGKYGSIIRGKTLVMDRDKYCEYTFWGIGSGLGGVGNAPLDMTYTKGYVYGVTDIADYCGLFLGGSNNLVAAVQGGAWAPGGVYAEIIGGSNVAASMGCSATYYVTSQSDWIYGAADFYIVPNAYQYSPLNPNMYI